MNKLSITTAILICLMAGLMIGYTFGTISTLNWVVNKAVYFLRLEGYEIGIDEKELAMAIQRYKNQIDWAYPTTSNDTRKKTKDTGAYCVCGTDLYDVHSNVCNASGF